MSIKGNTLRRGDTHNFFSALKDTETEQDVEKAIERAVTSLFRTFFTRLHPRGRTTLSYPHSTDGLIKVDTEDKELAVMFEVKRDLDFSNNRIHLAQVLVQVLYYLKRFAKAGNLIPAVTVVSDVDEIFAVPTNLIAHYLDEDHDWTLAPSTAGRENLTLTEAIVENKNIRPYIHTIKKTFDLEAFCHGVASLSLGEQPHKVSVTTENLEKLFANFAFDVLGGPGSAISIHEQVAIFISSLRGDEDTYPHPNKPNVLMMDERAIRGVNTYRYEQFWARYNRAEYSLAELKEITGVADTLITDFERRFTGDFWTPQIWVDRAHQMIEKHLGEDWKETYICVDPAAGALNLTRDYRFERLYSSTLFAEELDIASVYNTEATKYQYDFLNDDIDLHTGGYTKQDFLDDPALADKFKMPSNLIMSMARNEPIVFFANPPYGQATDQDGAKKATIATTAIGALMDSLSHARKELYTQFIYRVQLLAKQFEYTEDFHFFFFNKGFLTSPNFAKFTNQLTSDFTFRDGFMLNAGEFSGTSSAWGIIFSGWEIGGSEDQSLDFDVLQSSRDLEISKIADWTAKTVNKGETISDWLADIPLSKELDDSFPATKNGFDAPTSKSIYVKPRRGWIGYLHNGGNSVQFSDKYTGFYSMGFANAGGRDITRDNFTRAAVTFSIRRSVQEVIARQKLLWVRDKDNFTRPSDQLAGDPEFVANCVVYSLFDRQSKQTSLRNYEYGGKKHRVVNEFFPFSRDFINDLAVEHKNMDVQVDADGDHERFVYQWLTEHADDLSTEAKALLDIAKKLYEKSFHMRKFFALDKPRYQVGSWDAGWVQVYRMIFGNERLNDSLMEYRKEFSAAVTKLGDKIAKLAFDDGVI